MGHEGLNQKVIKMTWATLRYYNLDLGQQFEDETNPKTTEPSSENRCKWAEKDSNFGENSVKRSKIVNSVKEVVLASTDL